MIDVLRQGADIAELAVNMASTMTMAPQTASVKLDFTALDEATRLLRRAVDEMTVLGPLQLVEPLNRFLEAARATAKGSTSYEGLDEIEQKCAGIDEAKVMLLKAAAEVGLTA